MSNNDADQLYGICVQCKRTRPEYRLSLCSRKYVCDMCLAFNAQSTPEPVQSTPDDTIESVWPCPACGEPSDYCSGHGLLGDPIGAYVLALHDAGRHAECHPNARAECEG